MNEKPWNEWDGGFCPVNPDNEVEVKFRNGDVGVGKAGSFDWCHLESMTDILVYRSALPRDPNFKPSKPSTNPKDAIGSVKLPLHLWPSEATALGCLGMLEGRCKYGRNNYIAGDGVIASIYVDAAKRHLDAWFSGEENAPDTGTPHLANALATIAILVKARAHGKLIDDRDFAPIDGYRQLIEEITPHVKRIQEMFKDKNPKHYTIKDNKEE
jgi:hypothetical protein